MTSRSKLLATCGGAPIDANFRNVTLLLHGDGSNGAQNNTFLDSSSNNFTITRNGNTTQGSFSPYGSVWSNYFDGNGDFLSTPSNSAFAFGTGDFTVEGWIYATSTPSDMGIYEGRSTGAATDGFTLTAFSGSVIRIFAGGVLVASSGTNYVNQWVHFAVTRASGTTTLWINGVSQGTSTASYNCTNTDAVIGGGRYSGGSSVNTYFPGYVSNFRVVKGTAVYTSAFTPPTTPLTAITNTSLLTCQSNRFRDASTNNFAITRNGDVKVSSFGPFAPSAAYSTAVNGGSAYLDGSGDYLSLPSNAAFGFGTGDFTVECWVNPSSQGGHGSSNNDCIIDFRPGTGGGAYGTLYIVNSGAGVNWYANTTIAIMGGAIPSNAWSHLVVSRVSGSTRLFINGVQSGSTYSDSTNYGTTNPWIGQFNDGAGGGYFNGYISGFRIVKGSGVTSVTVPTTPHTAITNTSLLINGTNAAIFDNSAKNDLETVGNAQISASVKKFGTGSMYLDGSGDYLYIPSTSEFAFGAGDFTIEFWVYLSTTSGIQILYDNRPSNGAYPVIYMNGASLRYYVSSADRITGSNLTTGVWYHIAVSRSGTSTKMFLNGVQDGSTYTDSTSYLAAPLRVGADFTPSNYLNGYIDDLRITKGVARYTANFTPPAAAFPDQ